jgi:Crinkler effector protein N-terminal domain
MLTLYCAVVGQKGSAFPVKIDASESVGVLKDAIAAKRKYDFAADMLKLFLAKKGNEWLTQKQLEEGISDTSDFNPLEVHKILLTVMFQNLMTYLQL